MLNLPMNTSAIIEAIDQQIAQLQSARALLVGSQSTTTEARKPGRPKGVKNASTTSASSTAPKKRVMSAEGKARIAAAQKARWARQNAASGTAAKKSAAKKSAKSSGKKAPATKAASDE